MIDLIVSGPEDHINDLVTREDYDRAIKQLTMQVRLQPDNSAAREHLGNLLGAQMRLEEAQVQFQELVRLRPDYAEGLRLPRFRLSGFRPSVSGHKQF
jgi:protein involved in temperature-dependent protein secretion